MYPLQIKWQGDLLYSDILTLNMCECDLIWK